MWTLDRQTRGPAAYGWVPLRYEQSGVEPQIGELLLLLRVREHRRQDVPNGWPRGSTAHHEVHQPAISEQALQVVTHAQLAIKLGPYARFVHRERARRQVVALQADVKRRGGESATDHRIPDA